jgi:hypothetical protein
VEIKNIYNETNYYLEFGNWTNPNYDITNNNSINIRQESIPSFLGFNYKTYYPNVLYSNYLPSSLITNEDDKSRLNYEIITTNRVDASRNNYFTIFKYTGNKSYNTGLNGNIISDYSVNSIDASYEIKLSLPAGFVTRNQIVENLSNQIALQTYLTQSRITRKDISSNIIPLLAGNGNSQFELCLKFNRKETNNIENSKICVQFPDERKNKTSIWSGTTSCFNFPAILNELNNIYSETAPLKQTGNLISIGTNPYIYLSSCEKRYDVSSNDYVIPIANSTVGYTLNGFIDAINKGLENVTDINGNPKKTDFNLTNCKAFIDSNSKFNLQLDINKTKSALKDRLSGKSKGILGSLKSSKLIFNCKPTKSAFSIASFKIVWSISL